MKSRAITFILLLVFLNNTASAQIDPPAEQNNLSNARQEANEACELCVRLSGLTKESTLTACNKALILSRKAGMDSLTIVNLCQIADRLHYTDGPEASYKYLVEAKQIADNSNNPSLKMPAYYFYSLIWERYIDIDHAFDYLNQALEISNSTKNAYYHSKLIAGIGFLFIEEELYDEAKEYFLNGLRIAKEANNDASIAIMESNLAISFRELGEYQEANALYEKSYKYYEEKRDTSAMQRIVYGLGRLASKRGEYALSNTIFFGKLDSLGVKFSSSKFIKEVVASNYYQLHQYRQALALYKEIEPVATKLNDQNIRKKIYKGIADCYASLGQFEDATNYFQKYTYEVNSSAKQKLQKSIATAELKYKLETRNSENKYLLAEKENITLQSRAKLLKYVVFVIILALLSLLLIYIYDKQKKRNRFLKDISSEQERINNDLLNQSVKKDILNQELASRNQELSSFAGIVAHDVKAPLRTTIGFVQLLRNHIQKDSQVLDYLNFIEKSNLDLNALIDDLLAFTRSGKYSHDIELVDLNDIIHAVRNNLTHQINRNSAEIKAEQLPLIKANRTALIQLFQNLIANSIKFAKVNQTPIIQISTEETTDFQTILIKDNGIGIEQVHLKNIFDPLTKLHSQEKYEGSGLGLATCKKIIQYLGGTITVESKIGEGSIFRVNFPKKYVLEEATEDFTLN